MAKLKGVENEFTISGDRTGNRLLQGVERRMKSPLPILRINRSESTVFSEEMNTTSERMERLLGV